MREDRFSEYRDIAAKFDRNPATCGHKITAGDRIGYNPKTKHVRCTACWHKWQAENAEARMLEGNGQW